MMNYFFKNNLALLSLSLLLFHSIASMNIPGDITPISIKNHLNRDHWAITIPGGNIEQSCQETEKIIDTPHIIINSNRYCLRNDPTINNNSLRSIDFFRNLPIATEIASTLLNVNFLLVTSCFPYILRNSSANKNIMYLELCRKMICKLNTHSKYFIENFLHEFKNNIKNKDVDISELFTHMKVYYLVHNKYRALSNDDFFYLSRLNKKYTDHLNGKYLQVEITNRKALELMFDTMTPAATLLLHGLSTNAITNLNEMLFNKRSYTAQEFITFCFCATPVNLIFLRIYTINNTNNYTIEQFHPNQN